MPLDIQLCAIPVVLGFVAQYHKIIGSGQLLGLLLELHDLVYVYVVEEIKLNTLDSISGTTFYSMVTLL